LRLRRRGQVAGNPAALLVAYADMPEEVRADVEHSWEHEGARVAARVEERFAGIYAFTSYGVEN
ncbi:hypothetical protein ACFWF3_35830, partial [Nocardia sp. NPDC060220]|uniref:hypothetical protein n=1 Tax=Nocardia sp. NPDC060220 TaxID=3347076 RepID=UPI003655613B